MKAVGEEKRLRVSSKKKRCTSIGDKVGSVANIYPTAGPRVTYYASVANPPRLTRGRIRSTRRRSRSSSSVIPKGCGTLPGSVSLGSGSGFVVAKDG